MTNTRPTRATHPEPSKPRVQRQKEFVLGLSVQGVGPGQSAVARTAPQVLFNGESVAFPAHAAQHFEVTGLEIGGRSQLEQLKAGRFDPSTKRMHCDLDPCPAGVPITMNIVNRSDKTLDFAAVIYGKLPS